MSRRTKKKAPPVRRERFDLSGVHFSICALRGYGECDDAVGIFEIVDTRKVKTLPQRAVIGLCGHHGSLVRHGRLGEHLGIWIPSWVWKLAINEAQQDRILKEAEVMRSTARTCTPGELDDRQWPFWMNNEKVEMLQERDRRELIERLNQRRDDLLAANIAAAREVVSS